MEEIAVMVKLSTLADHVRSTFCNLDEGGLQRTKENDFICIRKEDLTEEQLKMSPYAICLYMYQKLELLPLHQRNGPELLPLHQRDNNLKHVNSNLNVLKELWVYHCSDADE